MADNLDIKGSVEIDVANALHSIDDLHDSVIKAWDTLSDNTAFRSLTDALEAAEARLQDFRTHMEELSRLKAPELNTLMQAGELGLIADPNVKKALDEVTKAHKVAEDERNSYARQADAEYTRIKDEGRRRELSALRSAIQERSQQEQAAEQERVLYAQQANADYIRVEEESRQQELGSLRAAIEERMALEREAEQERLSYAQQANADYIRMEEQSRQQELSALRDNIEERARIEQDRERSLDRLANTRYALYDLSNTLAVVSGATLGSAAAAVKLGADYEKSFASVRRTTLTVGAEAEDLKRSLVDLTHEMPKAFDEMTDIATLGAQMDIPKENLAEFTEVVAMFSSTTDVSVEEAARSFGRLAQLTETPIENIDRLGASIYHTGINSVATEGQILGIAEQIAVSGNLAGFTADEIVGLSAAMASLGVQPEAARGAIMRIFNNIRQAVDEGGEAVQKFADVSNTSVEEFSDAWLNRPKEAFTMLVEGLDQVAESGGSVSGTLKELGMSNVRDLRVMELLADNTDVYNKALEDSASSYARNTALAEGYGIETDNLNDQLVELINTFKDMLQSIGDIPGLTTLVRMVKSVAEQFQKLIQVPFVGHFAKIALAVMSGVGAWAAYQAVSTRATASTMGLITSIRGMKDSVGVVSTGVAGLFQALRTLRQELKEVELNSKGVSTSMDEQAASTNRAAASTSGYSSSLKSTSTEAKAVAASTDTAAASTGRLSGAMKKAGGAIRGATAAFKGFARATVIMAAISAVLSIGEKAWDKYQDSMKSAEDRTKEFIGSGEGLYEAMAKDGKIFEETGGKVGEFYDEVELSAAASDDAEQAYLRAADGQLQLEKSTDDATDAIEKQTLALGENARQHLAEVLEGKIDEMDLSLSATEILGEYDWDVYMDKLMDDVNNGTDRAGEDMREFLAVFDLDDSHFGDLDIISSYFDDLTNALESGAANTEFYTRQFDQVMQVYEGLGAELTNTLTPATQEFFETLSGKDEAWLSTKEGVAFLAEHGYAAAQELDRLADGARDAKPAVEELIEGLSGEGVQGELKRVAINMGIATEASGALSEDFDELGDGAEEAAEDIENLSDVMFGGIDSAAAMESALEDLGASLYENGYAFDEFSEEGRANLENLQGVISVMAEQAGEDTALFVSNVMELMGGLEAQGVDTVNELAFVYEHLLVLTGQKYGVDVSTEAARQNLLNLLQDGEAVQALLANLGAIDRQIKTAVGNRDWGSVFSLGKERFKASTQLAAVNDIKKQLSSASDAAANTGNAISNGLGRGWNDAAKAAKSSGGAGRKAGNDHKKGADKAKKATKDLKKELYTVTDYAKDLGSVMSSAFDFRFGGLQARDATRDIYQTMKDRIRDAADAYKKAVQDIMDANAKLATLRSDKKILEYQLTVATEYGDTLRESQIRAELAEKNAELSKAEKELADAKKASNAAQKDGSKTLKGTSAAARQNRADILNLVDSYQKQVEELANSGMSTSRLQKETKKLKDEFIRKTTQMGYSRKEVNKYAKSFDDMGTIIKTMPKNITVKTNMSPAKRAVQEFIKKKEKSKKLNTTVKKPTKKSVNAARKAAGGKGSVPIKTRVQAPTQSSVRAMGVKVAKWIRLGLKTVRMGLSLLGRSASIKFFQQGGYTGSGNPNELAGLTHKGEYVVPHQYVNQSTGLPDLNALGESLGMNTAASSRGSAPSVGVSVVELSARDRQLLAAAGNVSISLDGRVIADNTNRRNTNSSRRGIG